MRYPVLDLWIEDVAFGGDGIAHHDGKVYFVSDALPGERVQAQIIKDAKNFSRAKAVKILQSSEHRQEAPCVYYQRCGGCQYQHVSYLEELNLKHAQIKNLFYKHLNVADGVIGPIVYGVNDYRYRNSVTLHPTFHQTSPALSGMGFIAQDNKSVVLVKDCLLAMHAFEPVFQAKAQKKRKLDSHTFKVDIKNNLYSDSDEKFLRMSIGEHELLSSSKAFFQINGYVAGLLCEKVSDWFHRSEATTFVDLYSGVGTFAMLSASKAQKIICVEENPYSLQALNMNRQERGLNQLEVFPGSSEKVFESIYPNLDADKTFLCVDPPRSGLHPSLREILTHHKTAKHIAYISCDPLTLIRDLSQILKGGYYRLEEVVAFDMFPRTKHIETAVLLSALV